MLILTSCRLGPFIGASQTSCNRTHTGSDAAALYAFVRFAALAATEGGDVALRIIIETTAAFRALAGEPF